MNDRLASRPNRRTFLKSLGLLTGGLAFDQIPLLARPVSSRTALPSIGLLVPETASCPNLGRNLADGLKLALTQSVPGRAGEPALFTAPYGSSPMAAAEEARRLVDAHNVDLLVGVMNPAIAARLDRFLESKDRILLVADPGANIVRSSEHSGRIFYASLGYWQSGYAAGQWMVRNAGRRAFVASSFYESGFDALHAFRLGAESAGGEVAGSHISHVPPDPADMRRTMEMIGEVRPDFVYAVYSGSEAVDFVGAYAGSPSVRTIPLAGSAFLADQLDLRSAGRLSDGIRSCGCWSESIPGEENSSFMDSYRASTGRAADAFSLLGYESGLLIADAAGRSAGSLFSTLPDALRHAGITGPRGRVQMDPVTQVASGPLIVHETRWTGTRRSESILATIPPAGTRDAIIDAWRQETRTGWLNPYLCV